MLALLGMPQGAEWLVVLAIVVLLFGSAKLPALVRQLGKSKKIWEDEIGPEAKKPAGELGPDAQSPGTTEVRTPIERPMPEHRS